MALIAFVFVLTGAHPGAAVTFQPGDRYEASIGTPPGTQFPIRGVSFSLLFDPSGDILDAADEFTIGLEDLSGNLLGSTSRSGFQTTGIGSAFNLLPPSSETEFVIFLETGAGSSFDLTALNITLLDTLFFAVETVNVVDDLVLVSTVPAPAAAPLLLVGLAAFGAMARRRRN